MQMLFDGSDESPGVAGLGVLPGRVTRLPGDREAAADAVEHARRSRRARSAARRPARSRVAVLRALATRPSPTDDAVVAAWCDYGGRFAAAVEAGPVWATQFHPEKSGAVGLRLLQNFVDVAARRR